MQNYFPMASKLNKANVKKIAKSISTFDFSTLYTTIPHKPLQQVLLEVINWPSNLNSENIYLLDLYGSWKRIPNEKNPCQSWVFSQK